MSSVSRGVHKVLQVKLTYLHPFLAERELKKIRTELDSLELLFHGPVAFPTIIKRFNILRSPFKHKKAQQTYERRGYPRLLNIFVPSSKNQYLDRVVSHLKDLAHDAEVKMQVKLYYNQDVPRPVHHGLVQISQQDVNHMQQQIEQDPSRVSQPELRLLHFSSSSSLSQMPKSWKFQFASVPEGEGLLHAPVTFDTTPVIEVPAPSDDMESFDDGDEFGVSQIRAEEFKQLLNTPLSELSDYSPAEREKILALRQRLDDQQTDVGFTSANDLDSLVQPDPDPFHNPLVQVFDYETCERELAAAQLEDAAAERELDLLIEEQQRQQEQREKKLQPENQNSENSTGYSSF